MCFARPVEPPGSRSINPTPGKIGSGGPTVGPPCCGHRVIGHRSRLSSFWVQCVCGILGCPLRLGENRLRDDPRRSAGHKISHPQNPGTSGHCPHGHTDLCSGDGRHGTQSTSSGPCCSTDYQDNLPRANRGPDLPQRRNESKRHGGQRCYDHCGATEIGAWGFKCSAQPGALHVNEAMFLAEVEDLETGMPVTEPGQGGKLDHHGPG